MRYILFLLLFFNLFLPAHSMVREYFNTFYYDYLKHRGVIDTTINDFDFLHSISNDKVNSLDKTLNKAETYPEKQALIALIDEEYHDLKENLDFESEYINACPISRRVQKRFKKAHKKFMRQLKNNYLKKTI